MTDTVLGQTHRIDGRVVEVKRAVPKEESLTRLTSATKLDRRKLFVGGLPGSVGDAEFRAYFERFGPIVDAVVMIDRDTNRSRGFGFVTFLGEDSAAAVLGEPPGSHVLGDKAVEVKAAEPKP